MDIKTILAPFNLRDIEAKLFEKLYYGGETSASELARQANVSRTSIYDLIQVLIDRGLVYETVRGSVKAFSVQPANKLQQLFKEEEKKINVAKQALTALEETAKKKDKGFVPNLQIFQSQPALQQMMNDMLLYSNSHAYSYWPLKHVVEVLTPEFFEAFHKERIASNITVDMLLPHDEHLAKSVHSYLKKHYFEGIHVRMAPKGVDFTLGYTVYGGNTVRFISSAKEGFGYLIKSKELADTMAGQFKVLWDLSTDLKVN